MVPKAGLEPAQAWPTTPSRWRVYQVPPLRRILQKDISIRIEESTISLPPTWLWIVMVRKAVVLQAT